MKTLKEIYAEADKELEGKNFNFGLKRIIRAWYVRGWLNGRIEGFEDSKKIINNTLEK